MNKKLIEDHSTWLLQAMDVTAEHLHGEFGCLLYTSPSPRD